jgi:drug/metabolite transporter (DMT)-like permease
MQLTKNLGFMLLALWLFLYAILTAPFLGIDFTYRLDLLAVLAIVAGVVLLLQRRDVGATPEADHSEPVALDLPRSR